MLVQLLGKPGATLSIDNFPPDWNDIERRGARNALVSWLPRFFIARITPRDNVPQQSKPRRYLKIARMLR